MTPKELIRLLEQLSDDTTILVGDCDFVPTKICSIYFDPNYNQFIVNGKNSTNYEPPEHLIYRQN